MFPVPIAADVYQAMQEMENATAVEVSYPGFCSAEITLIL